MAVNDTRSAAFHFSFSFDFSTVGESSRRVESGWTLRSEILRIGWGEILHNFLKRDFFSISGDNWTWDDNLLRLAPGIDSVFQLGKLREKLASHKTGPASYFPRNTPHRMSRLSIRFGCLAVMCLIVMNRAINSWGLESFQASRLCVTLIWMLAKMRQTLREF